MFLNPPYSKRAGKKEFIAKLAESYTLGSVTAATVVLSYDFSAPGSLRSAGCIPLFVYSLGA